MHELYCPSCNTPSQYNFSDYLLMCPFCSGTFHFDMETGQKELFGDHYIVPNTVDSATVKDLAMEWLKRLHHKPGLADSEFFVVDIQGMEVPFWIVSMEGHTAWKGLVQKRQRNAVYAIQGQDHLVETGQFRRSYRWAVSARANICELWGLTRMHEPPEKVKVEWDGFPFDSTLSRGKLSDTDEQKSAYEIRKHFEFKFANGLPLLGVQVPEEEALRRARAHVDLYHYKLACLNVDYLIDHRTELEIAGIQLIHVPFWRVHYVYRPRTILRYLMKPKERRILIDGYGKGMLKGELAVAYHDKVMVNAMVCGLATVLFLLLGGIWHPAFYLVSLFAAIVASISAYMGLQKKAQKEREELLKMSSAFEVERNGSMEPA